ncbi:Spaf_1101 family AAA-like ATPase [Cohnella yongneupensis]|uniref:Spaf_1101 family AAA-like ATPase n=1 Tax=Cohnella yongneupensis TaxID=425006 RepID=A0ABW0QTI0_9BACL
MSNPLLKKYNDINKARNKYGEIIKCEFHLHTPASHDYRLEKDMKYVDLSDEEVINIAFNNGYINTIQKDHFLDEIRQGLYASKEYKLNLESDGKPFSSLKEYMSYKLIAHRLFQENIQLVVVTDHNTIDGYDKLKYALIEYYIERYKGKEGAPGKISLILGIEISCSEQVHLVGMFDTSMINSVRELINYYIPSHEGTYETSYSILNKISAMGGIGYIAHINSLSLKTTGLYKSTLFNDKNLYILGLTTSDVIEREKNKLIVYGVNDPENKFCFINEGDAHELSQIGVNNTWIKISNPGFFALKRAFVNHKFCVYLEKPKKTNKYIKGILIDPGTYGYLRKQHDSNDNNFNVNFSRDLNCIIGGRGTGKSTLLNILELLFTLETDSEDKLRFISKNKYIIVLFVFNGNEYLLRFIPQVEENSYSTGRSFFSPKAFIEYKPSQGKIVLQDHWVELYKVQKSGSNNIDFITITNNC